MSEEDASLVTVACIFKDSSRDILGYDKGDVVALYMKRKGVIQFFRGYLGMINAVAMSGDGKRIAPAVGADGTQIIIAHGERTQCIVKLCSRKHLQRSRRREMEDLK